jgi:hypothetical protein
LSGRLKYTVDRSTGAEQIFDVHAGELSSLLDAEETQAVDLLRAAAASVEFEASGPVALPPDEVDRLRALGYLE